MCKYIVVVGGVISGTGKGISAASIGLLLNLRGMKIQTIKFDPYYNSNADLLAPREHGEAFLCDDGSVTDLDLGHYERIIGINVSGKNILTTGTLFKEIFKDEEEGKYIGQTIQVIPHVTDKIIEKLINLGKDMDTVIVEIGGTVGDIESEPFLRAVRQFKQRNPENVLVIMVAPILWVPTIKEFKTKPLQQSLEALNTFGIQADILLCRNDRPLPNKILDKVSSLTNVPREAVFDAPDVETIYQVPIAFYDRHIDDLIADKFHLKRNGCRIHKYRDVVEKYVKNTDVPSVEIGIVGKYDNCDEAYLSLKEAIYHAGVAQNVRTNIHWISAEELEPAKDMRGIWSYFDGIHGVIVPGGFDIRGVEGKIKAIKYVREKKIPFLGICLGLQCAVIEYMRSRGLQQANSEEFDSNTPYKVIHLVKGHEGATKKLSTMRLGAYDCELMKDSLAFELYKKKLISERHRHHYEVNPYFVDSPEFNKPMDFRVSGKEPISGLIEMMEMDKNVHPFFIGTQAHPEFKSRLTQPSPLFNGLIAAAIEKKNAENVTT